MEARAHACRAIGAVPLISFHDGSDEASLEVERSGESGEGRDGLEVKL